MSATLYLLKVLAPPLARALFTVAFRDQITGGDLAETLTDSLDLPGIIKRLAGGDERAAATRSERFFQDFSEEVVDNLALLFDKEGDGLADPVHKQVSDVIAETLNQHAVTLLLQSDMDRDKFTKALLALKLPPRLIAIGDEQAVSLYKRTLQEIVLYVYALHDKLPEIRRATTAETMRRLSSLQGQLETIIDQQKRVIETSYGQHVSRTDQRFELEYRRTVANALDRMEMFGVTDYVPDHRPPLSVAFVTVGVTVARDKEIGEGIDRLGLDHEREQTLPATQALAQGKRLLIEARAGMGKTTLLKWLAVHTGQQDLDQHDENLTGWRDKIPFFLRLRDVARGELPYAENLPDHTKGIKEFVTHRRQGWVTDQLLSGRALVLIDGLDEVRQARRQETIKWLEGLINFAPNATYIVSTRPMSGDNDMSARFDQLGFLVLRLRRLDDEGIKTCVTKWHDAMQHPTCTLAEVDKQGMSNLSRRLLDSTLANNPRLHDLACTPLLCTMICALHHERRGHLPQDRIALYDACINMLLEGRDRERGVDLSDYRVSLDVQQKRRLLGNLANRMLSQNVPVIRFHILLEKLGDLGHNSVQVLRLLEDRSSLLLRISEDEYEFAHRTFLEYLAATDIARKREVRSLCQYHAHDKEWAETIRLTAGCLVSDDDQSSLLQKLWEIAEPTLLQKLKGFTQAKQNHEDQTAQKSYLHLLALECFGMLKAAARETIQIAQQHAIPLVKEQILNVSNTQVADLTPLQNLQQLQRLNVSHTQVADLTPLQNLQQLQNLSVSHTQVADLTPLQNLQQLRFLDVSHTQVADLTPLQNLQQLQLLDVYNTQVADLTPLQNLQQLQFLNVSNTQVADLTPLQNLEQLQTLSVSNTQVADLTPLQNLEQLQILDVSHTQVADLTPLQNLEQLQILDVSNTQVADLTPLQNLQQLQNLYVSNTQVADLTPLQNLEQLQTLSVSNTQVADLTPLQNLEQLQILSVSNTLIQNLAPLAQCTGLQLLDLRASRARDLSLLRDLPQLKGLYVSYSDSVPNELRERVQINPPESPFAFWLKLL